MSPTYVVPLAQVPANSTGGVVGAEVAVDALGATAGAFVTLPVAAGDLLVGLADHAAAAIAASENAANARAPRVIAWAERCGRQRRERASPPACSTVPASA